MTINDYKNATDKFNEFIEWSVQIPRRATYFEVHIVAIDKCSSEFKRVLDEINNLKTCILKDN